MNEESHTTSAFFARVEGRVQGVGFRQYCMNEAQRLKLSGWVRNTAEGDVEVWAEGTAEKLDLLLKWLHRGPPSARVDTVRCEKKPATGQYRRFTVTH